MRSRLAVSLLFIVIASTFTSDAIADFKKLRSWGGEIYRSCAVDVLGKNYAISNQACVIGAVSPNGESFAFSPAEVAKLLTWLGAQMQSVVFKVARSDCHCAAFDVTAFVVGS
jgi:hypothetical protein